MPSPLLDPNSAAPHGRNHFEDLSSEELCIVRALIEHTMQTDPAFARERETSATQAAARRSPARDCFN
jgi:hypothetical protein